MRRPLAILVTAALAAPASAAAARHFQTEGASRVTCDADAHSVTCLIESPQVPLLNAIRVTMTPDARLAICRGVVCEAGSTETAPTLRYGGSIAVEPFRCTSLRTGIRCVVTASGRGFTLGRAGYKRV